jgi:hypothetical protein
LPTLTDERRKWEAKRLMLNYGSTVAESWWMTFPRSTANDNSARTMRRNRIEWFKKNFPEEMQKWGEEQTRAAGLPYGGTFTPRGWQPPRRRPPRGRTERERLAIERAARIIICYCVFRFPLERCWRIAVPGFTGTPNSARILAQRAANNFIRRYPGAAQVVLENSSRKRSAIETRHRRKGST